MLLLSHIAHPHNPAVGLPTHTHIPTRRHTRTGRACTWKHMSSPRTRASSHTPTREHTHADLCVEVVHACLVELSYVERIFDLSQAANQLLYYLHLVSWVCWLLGPSPASDAGYRGSQREIPTHSCL